MLVILDGWGLGQDPKVDATVQAKTPTMDRLLDEYPNSTLVTFGESVGLPEGQMGNSEVGHLNIGAGRIVYQDLAKINLAIRDGSIRDNPVLQEAIRYAKENEVNFHLMGLISDGGVHAHIDHLKAIARILADQDLQKIYVHGFTDGRDVDPKSGLGFVSDLEEFFADMPVDLVSIIGRYYAMDRDERWERTKQAYDLLIHGQGRQTKDLEKAVSRSYQNGITDEFILPICKTDDDGEPLGRIKENDVVFFINFRTDRPRQITRVLTQEDFPEFHMTKLPLYFVTMTKYDEKYKGLHTVFEKDNLSQTIGEIISATNLTQVRIAETEKYPHVTFFFSGGREKVFPGEKRIMIPSPKVATYDLAPEMGARQITKEIIEEMDSNCPDFVCLNFANTDMVGHTGDFEAAMVAASTVDSCLSDLLEAASRNNYEVIVIADHGNADMMVNPDGTPNTAHTMNPVPCIWVSERSRGGKIKDGKLADIAPTLLSLMGVEIPKIMTGDILVDLGAIQN